MATHHRSHSPHCPIYMGAAQTHQDSAICWAWLMLPKASAVGDMRAACFAGITIALERRSCASRSRRRAYRQLPRAVQNPRTQSARFRARDRRASPGFSAGGKRRAAPEPGFRAESQLDADERPRCGAASRSFSPSSPQKCRAGSENPFRLQTREVPRARDVR